MLFQRDFINVTPSIFFRFVFIYLFMHVDTHAWEPRKLNLSKENYDGSFPLRLPRAGKMRGRCMQFNRFIFKDVCSGELIINYYKPRISVVCGRLLFNASAAGPVLHIMYLTVG